MRERGFTLVEVLVALTISGIIATSLVSLLIGQSRFYEHTDDQMNAEQVAQATFALLSTELRMAGGTDLLLAKADSVSFRFDVLRAIVCDQTSSDAAAIYVYDRNSSPNLTGSFIGIAVSGPYEEEFEYEDGWNPTPSGSGSGPKSVCVAAGTPSTGSASDYLELGGWGARFSEGVPERGALFRFYGQVRYTIEPSTFFASRLAIWRGNQELVGPFAAGAAFHYLMDDGSVQSSVPASDFDRVVAVGLTATAVGDGADRFDVERSIDFEVPFRN